MKDITTRKDIELLIRNFYENLLKIDEMKPIFEGLNFEKHIPDIVSFWSLILLDEEGYKTNVFKKHMHLPIKLHQFDVWLSVFISTTDLLYKGETAELAKQRATSLTYTFKSKWGALNPEI